MSGDGGQRNVDVRCEDYQRYGEAKLMFKKMEWKTHEERKERGHAELREEKVSVDTRESQC